MKRLRIALGFTVLLAQLGFACAAVHPREEAMGVDVTRRSIVKAGIGVAGLASVGAPLEAGAQGIAERKALSVFRTIPGAMDDLRAGIKAMADRNASDPSSLFWQGAVHWYTLDEARIAEKYRQDPNAAKGAKYWNQCTHLGAKPPYDFILWHRAYLYHFERHLRAVLGKPQFALPYWDYNGSSSTARAIPAEFASPANSSNPLWSEGRDMAPGDQLSTGAVSLMLAMAEPMYFGLGAIRGFGGTSGSGGRLDGTPHGAVHGEIGGLMGNVLTAGFDPIFWVHHASIDRLFNVWLTSRTRYWGDMPGSSWLTDAPWTFIEPDGKEARNARAFYADLKNLGYRYDTDPVTIPAPRSGRPPSAIAGAGVNAMNVSPETKSFIPRPAGETSKPVSVSTSQTTRVNVPLGRIQVEAAGKVGEMSINSALESSAERQVEVVLEGVKVPRDMTGNLQVFANLPKDAVPNRDSINYLGTLNRFDLPRQDAPPSGHEHPVRFDATALMRSLGRAALQQLELAFVPSGPVDAEGKPKPLKEGAVSIEKIRIQVLEGSKAPTQ